MYSARCSGRATSDSDAPKLSAARVAETRTATAALGTTATLTTPIPLKNGHTYYIRVGARMNYTTFGGIIYNYTDVRKIIAP